MTGLAAASPPRSTGRRAFPEWPRPDDRRRLGETASLVGRQLVTAPASPTIDVTLDPADDFLPPVRMAAARAGSDGSLDLDWQPVSRARAIAVTAVGAGGGKHRGALGLVAGRPGQARAGAGLPR